MESGKISGREFLKGLLNGALMVFLGGLVLKPSQANAQEAEEYIEYWQEEVEKEIRNKVDWRYWEPWEFYINGGPWKVLDDVTINVRKLFLDSLIDPLPPDDLPGKELRRYYLVVDASFRTLEGGKIIYPSGDFFIKDEDGRKIWTSDYEGNNVNGYPKLGKRVSMYEALNPGKLKLVYPNTPPFDEVKIGAAREFAVPRKICFAIGENYVYRDGRRIKAYLHGNIWLGYGKDSIFLTNIENFLREGYYKIEEQESERQDLGKLFGKVIDFLGGYGPTAFYNSELILKKTKTINKNSIMFYYDEKHKLGWEDYTITPDSFVGVFNNKGDVLKVIRFVWDGSKRVPKEIRK